ncbi:MAG TPA: hypothetical protein VGQ55_07910 [Pyrinomonadaceae bacterium]|nr:hypothetical protein [Pyrinomonadaceae bacterium]
MDGKAPIFDTAKAREAIANGRRRNWWHRKGSKSTGFVYTDSSGKRIIGKEPLDRIASLVIPPAWKHVRISPWSGGRLQAVGMDTTGRIQYLYNPKFTEKQQRKKFAKIEKFGYFLPKLRKITNEHISLDGYPRKKILAVIMRLINSLYFRVGTEESKRNYGTYGITTFQNKHLTIGRKGTLTFDFVGKSHVQHRKVLVDEELAEILKDLKELGPKRKLFHYIDDHGKVRAIKPSEINRYLKDATSAEFSSKDFRTWGGTLLAAVELAEIGPEADEKEAKKTIVKVVKKVAAELGNTPAVCRASYVHPIVIQSYEKGITLTEFQSRKSRRIKRLQAEFEPEEKALLKLFEAN